MVKIAKLPLREFAVFATVAMAVWLVWLASIGPTNAFQTIGDNWKVAVTMVFGSFVAGASSEGGGAVAFPVFTKILRISPADAKLFALAIQSIGMTSAAIAIGALRVRIDWGAIGAATLGGVAGIWLSLIFIAPQAPAAETKMLFTALQASFAVALLIVLRRSPIRVGKLRFHGSPTTNILGFGLLMLAGFFGGIASGLVGSGIDLVVFSMLVLLFRLDEKVATPTSVVIMAINSIVGMAIHHLYLGPLPVHVQSMWWSAVPIVVIGAPLGALVCSRLDRRTIAFSLIGLISIEVTTSFLLLPITRSVIFVAMIAGLGFSIIYYVMARTSLFEPTNQYNTSSWQPNA